MGISHLPVNLRFRNQCRNGVHNHDIHRSGAHHGFRNLQSLLSIIRLGNIKIINIYPNILSVNRIQSMFCVNKTRDSSPLLNLCYHMQRYCSLTR